MGKSGAPTSQWPTVPEQKASAFELSNAEARLVVRRADVPDVEIRIDKPEFFIGRSVDGVDLTLDDEQVSRRHARLSVNERGYFRLEDLDSKNGVEYLGRKTRRLNLVDGDVFKIGEAEITFHAKMNRFTAPAQSRRAPRLDSVFVDIPIPTPEPEPEDDGEDIGWSPEKMQPELPPAPAPAPDPAEKPPETPPETPPEK